MKWSNNDGSTNSDSSYGNIRDVNNNRGRGNRTSKKRVDRLQPCTRRTLITLFGAQKNLFRFLGKMIWKIFAPEKIVFGHYAITEFFQFSRSPIKFRAQESMQSGADVIRFASSLIRMLKMSFSIHAEGKQKNMKV